MPRSPKYTFQKGERLTKKRDIQALFQSKEAFICYPFRVLFCKLDKKEEDFSVQVLISVPKRKIKLAVNRNLLKRRTREAYRLQKANLIETAKQKDGVWAVGIVYLSEEICSYEEIHDAMSEILTELKERL